MGSGSSTPKKSAANEPNRFPRDPLMKSIVHIRDADRHAGVRGFPSDPSLKSISSFGDDDFHARVRGFPSNSSIKSIEESDGCDIEDRSSGQLRSRVAEQDKELAKLKAFNAKLQGEVKQLQSTIDQLTLQLNLVAKPPKSTPTNKPRNGAQPLGPAIKMSTESGDERNLPRIGDHVVAMWGQSKWQYFTATIQSFDQNTLKYTIQWDDDDPTGRVVNYFNLALDQVPSADQIGVGSKVLFHQGQYRQQEVHGVTRSGGMRWHEGEIEKIYSDQNGNKRYSGRHTKGEEDGKWVSYKDYKEQFVDYTLEDFRMPPNVFDILASIETDGQEYNSNEQEDDIDVFVSYVKINCPSAIAGQELTGDLPPSYDDAVLQNMCDPRDIVTKLKNMGIRVFTMENDGEDSLLEIVSALKRVKVFIACLSDEYASNDRCRMEFQYAKKTMKLPVIPLVVGSGSLQWQMTVVGLLLAGELYIHFKDKEVEGLKMTELARTIKNFLPNIKIQDVRHAATGDGVMELVSAPGVAVTGQPLVSGKADLFFSYCWSNSKDAETRKQMPSVVGNEFNDPRVVQKKLSSAINIPIWLDIERLESAADGMGMFAQMASALNDCKLMIACVSSEYAESENCRMEIQFAVKSLFKPVIVVVVGKGEAWKDTTVGQLVQEGLPTVNMQEVNDMQEMEEKMQDIAVKIKEMTGLGRQVDGEKPSQAATTEEKPKFRAPVPGDHVVCLHQKWAYFMAKIDSFDAESMSYTVIWDDGDPTGRVQSYKDVALDSTPTGEIGVGTIVLFSQGSYGATDGNNVGGVRYHQGKITNIYQDASGVTRFDGEHTKSADDGKWVTFTKYEPTFRDKTREDLRLPPNAMDALMACKQAFL